MSQKTLTKLNEIDLRDNPITQEEKLELKLSYLIPTLSIINGI